MYSAGVQEKHRQPPKGLKWPQPCTVALERGKPKWSTSPVVLVDSSRGQESLGKGSTHSIRISRNQKAAQEGTKSTAARSERGSGTSFSNSLEAELAVRAAVALCQGDSLALFLQFHLLVLHLDSDSLTSWCGTVSYTHLTLPTKA